MHKNQRTLYIDDITYENITEIASSERLSVSSMVRLLINHWYYQEFQGGLDKRSNFLEVP